MKKPKTWISDQPETEPPARKPEELLFDVVELPPVEALKSPNDLPIPVRQKIIELYRAGIEPTAIAHLFSVPVDWILIFTEGAPGDTEH